MLANFLPGKLSRLGQLIQGRLGDFQIDSQLFDGEYIVLIYSHHTIRIRLIDNIRS